MGLSGSGGQVRDQAAEPDKRGASNTDAKRLSAGDSIGSPRLSGMVPSIPGAGQLQGQEDTPGESSSTRRVLMGMEMEE